MKVVLKTGQQLGSVSWQSAGLVIDEGAQPFTAITVDNRLANRPHTATETGK